MSLACLKDLSTGTSRHLREGKRRNVAKITNCTRSKLWRLIKRRKKLRHETDEWRDYDVPFQRLEKVYNPDEDSVEERMNIFHGQLYRNIKRKLWSSRREDPPPRKSFSFAVLSSSPAASATRTIKAQDTKKAMKPNFPNFPAIRPTAKFFEPRQIWYQNAPNLT